MAEYEEAPAEFEQPVEEFVEGQYEGELEGQYEGELEGQYEGEGYEEDDGLQAVTAEEVKLFGKWSFDEIDVRDISLVDYIACKGPHATYLPHTAGRYQKKRFRKASCPIVERLALCLMRKGRNSGKKVMACRIVQHTLEIISLLTDQNPIQVVVDAIINSGPREDSTRVGGAGVVRRQAVDMSPFRRVNYALYLLAQGAREASFRNLKTMAECLAEELINAARGSSNSYAIKKKDEIERVSKSNR
jgi:small subunit ribosomal protein S5e